MFVRSVGRDNKHQKDFSMGNRVRGWNRRSIKVTGMRLGKGEVENSAIKEAFPRSSKKCKTVMIVGGKSKPRGGWTLLIPDSFDWGRGKTVINPDESS